MLRLKSFFILKNEFAEAEKTIYKCLKLTEATGKHKITMIIKVI